MPTSRTRTRGSPTGRSRCSNSSPRGTLTRRSRASWTSAPRPSAPTTPTPRRSSISTTGRNSSSSRCGAASSSREGRSLLFQQDDLEIVVGRLRELPFRHLDEGLAVRFPSRGFPAFHQPAQQDPCPVFHLIDREKSRHFADLLSFPRRASLPPVNKTAKSMP